MQVRFITFCTISRFLQFSLWLFQASYCRKLSYAQSGTRTTCKENCRRLHFSVGHLKQEWVTVKKKKDVTFNIFNNKNETGEALFAHTMTGEKGAERSDDLFKSDALHSILHGRHHLTCQTATETGAYLLKHIWAQIVFCSICPERRTANLWIHIHKSG